MMPAQWEILALRRLQKGMETNMDKHLRIETHPVACAGNIVQGVRYRITVLTPRLLRLEYSPDGQFEDGATQTVLNRDFPETTFQIKETEDELQIMTEGLQLNYDKKEFTSHGLSCKCLGQIIPFFSSTWHFGVPSRNLKGTARTLDGVDGACELEDGILSRGGHAVLDDSKSLLLTEDGFVKPRKKGIQDLYFFGYGHDYLGALKDFYHLCGKTPMLPRFALGNWWSRYYQYTEKSYMELMDRFEAENVPFSVAVIDMDWHLVDIDPKYGTGWTGYTWNKEFFPDPARFLRSLHDRGMKTTLNVHPADGFRAYEECYPRVAEAMGVDTSKEEPVNFDIADPKFLSVYFEQVHHPMEKDGVDFWWLDWQQGTNTKIEGLDPLWMLNHFHYLDSGRDGKRPMTFSRYAGPGSHRYPVGFSGDTMITWDSLDFQPYFTNTASNIGYGWWSHDIGGHMMGYRNEELEVRWYQYGVLSPINRLHSSNSHFSGKEPWKFGMEAQHVMSEFLRLRHRMIPYLYTMNYRAWKDDQPICQPVYYVAPDEFPAYEVPNEYLFGSELLVAPVTTKRIPSVNLAKVKAWFPEGLWFDFFTGTAYRGGRSMELYRPLSQVPVLAHGGAIVPMTDKISALDAGQNPDSLEIRVYAGADGSFTLYEDDNVSCDYEKGICAKTPMSFYWTDKKAFVLHPAEGNVELIPGKRSYSIRIFGSTAETASVLRNGSETQSQVTCYSKGHEIRVEIVDVNPNETVEIRLPADAEVASNPVVEQVDELLNAAEISFMQKEILFARVKKCQDQLNVLVGELQAMELDDALRGALLEIITAY